MRFLFTSDLHGRDALYERLWAIAPEYEGVILGGDLLPNVGGLTPRPQRDYLVNLLRRITALRREHPRVRFYALLGNDDWGANQDLLEESAAVEALAGKVFPLGGGWSICGYGYVNPTPFGMKDWERWDLKPGESGHFSRDGYRSAEGEIRPFMLSKADHETIAADLETLSHQIEDFSKTLCVTHAPPYGTPLDQIASGSHVGSRAIRQFIERHQPLLTLHGHIHESPQRTGKWATHIGETLSINPGQSQSWNYVTFSLKRPLRAEHSIYGTAGGGDQPPVHE